MPPQPPQIDNRAKRLVKIMKVVVPLIVLIAAVIAAVYFLQFQSKSPAKHTYDRLDSYSVVSTEGTGMSFNQPVELKEQFATSSQVELLHAVRGKLASYIAAAYSPTATPMTDAELQTLTNSLSNTSDAFYLPSTNALKTFVVDRTPAGAKTNFGDAKPFTSQNIKANVWQFDLQIDIKENKKLSGKAVFAASKRSYYYFMALAPDYNWQANQAIWQQVINSLKIDQ